MFTHQQSTSVTPNHTNPNYLSFWLIQSSHMGETWPFKQNRGVSEHFLQATQTRWFSCSPTENKPLFHSLFWMKSCPYLRYRSLLASSSKTFLLCHVLLFLRVIVSCYVVSFLATETIFHLFISGFPALSTVSHGVRHTVDIWSEFEELFPEFYSWI